MKSELMRIKVQMERLCEIEQKFKKSAENESIAKDGKENSEPVKTHLEEDWETCTDSGNSAETNSVLNPRKRKFEEIEAEAHHPATEPQESFESEIDAETSASSDDPD